MFISNAGIGNVYFIFAITDKEMGSKSMSVFIVPADSKGLSFGRNEDKMGARAMPNGEIILEDVRIPKENLLGKEGAGMKIISKVLNEGRPLLTGSLSVGLAREAYEVALNYAKQRMQFGRPIIRHQAIGFKLADMYTKIETARLMVWKACWLVDNNLSYGKESCMAKYYCSDIAMEVTTEAVQVLGGYGYMKDFPVEKFMRDAKLLQIYEGTNEIQRLILSSQL